MTDEPKPAHPGREAGGAPLLSLDGVAGCAPLRLTQEELRSLLRDGSDWIWETDAELRFRWLSAHYRDVTGIDPATVLGRFRFDFLNQGVQADLRAQRHLEDLEARRPFRDFTYELKGARPDCRWISTSGTPRFGPDGRFLGYRGVARNVTGVAAAVLERSGQMPAAEQDSSAGQRMVETLNVLTDSVCYYDSEDHLLLYNDAFGAMFPGLQDVIRKGVTFGELLDVGIDRRIWDFGDEDADAWRPALLAERSAHRASQSLIKMSDGRSIMHRQIPTAEGGLLSICTDVSELEARRADAERANRRTRRLLDDLQRTIDAMDLGIVLVDADMNAEIINRTFYDMWNVDSHKVPVGSPFRELMDANRHNGIYQVPDANWEAYVAERMSEIRAGAVTPREFLRADGRVIIYSVTVLSRGKRLVSYFDMTEMKHRERELADINERFRIADAVLNTIRDPIFVKDAQLRFTMVNKAFAALVGCRPEEVVGRRVTDFVTASFGKALERSEARILETGEEQETEEDFELHGIGRSRIVRKTTVRMASGNRYLAGLLLDVTQVKQREVEARQVRKQLEDVLESMPAGVIIYDRDDRFVLANRKLKSSLPGMEDVWQPGRTLRYALETAHDLGYFTDSGDPELDALYHVDRARWVDGYTRRYHQPSLVSERPHPNDRWFQLYDMRTPDGTFIGVRVDITEIKQREAALRDSMRQIELFQHVLDDLPVATNIKSDDLTLEYVNKAWSELTGIPKSEAVGRTDAELFSAQESDGFTSDDASVNRDGGRIETEERVTHRDGTVHELMTRKGSLVTSDGQRHVFGSSTDITELKGREAMLKESLRENEIFRSLIDNLPTAIYAKKPTLQLLYVNKGWSDLTGVPREKAIGRTDFEIFGEEGRPFMEADQEILHSRASREIQEVITKADGTTRHQRANKSAFVASDGTLYLIGSTVDMTEQVQREQELREARLRAELADRAKSEFLANMSHEIRTPMNGVLGMAELLARSDLDAKQKTFTDIIMKSGNALLTIINDILDFSKIDAGQLVLDPAPFNLVEAIEDVATLLSTRAKEKDIELIVRVAPGLHADYVGDVGRVRQIVTNLMGNAVKFTEAGHVLVQMDGTCVDGVGRLRISVTDTGIGIPADKRALVFEKFSQVDASSTRRHEGTGLGLAITARLVEMMGGTIGVESEEGVGSTFWFTVDLPVARAAGERKPVPVDVTGARILVVDDNEVNRVILSEQMTSWRFDACAVGSGEDALAFIDAIDARGMEIDCIVLDFQMPGMNGLDLARAIRTRTAQKSTPIILLTSVDQAPSNAGWRDLGIHAHLIKPTRSSPLLEAIVTAIQSRRAPLGEALEPVRRHVAAAVPAEGRVRTVTAQGSRVDILVAEDNEVNQLVFTQILSESGLTFQIVGNGRLAVEMWRQMRPRLVLMDVSMPEMNGLEATATIRAEEGEGGERTPIVGVTAHALKGDRERCLAVGMDDYLAKPISPRALQEKIDRWFGGYDPQERQTAG
jgi:PAS domain S-box-containing protein